MSSILNHISSKIDNFINERESKKKQKIFQKAILEAAYANTPFLKYHLGQNLISIIMILLQFISIFTTYAGANYYLRGVNPLAPVLFAIAIQAGLLYLANSYANTTRKKGYHFLLLLLFTFISIVFSYTGLAIVSIPPENEYEKVYQEYSTALNIVKNDLSTKALTDEEVQKEMNNFLAQIKNIATDATNKRETIKIQITELKESKIKPHWISSNDMVTYGLTSEERSRNSEIENTITRYNSFSTELEKLIQALNSISITPEDLTSYVTNNTSMPNDEIEDITQITSSILTNYNNTINILNNYDKDLNNPQGNNLSYEVPYASIESDYFNKLIEQYKNTDSYNSLALQYDFSEANATSTSGETSNIIIKFLESLLNNETSASTAQETLKKLQKDVENNYNAVTEYIGKTNLKEKTNITDLTTARQELNTFGDPNVQVISYIFNPKYFNKVLGVLALTVLIDGLTLILGLFNNKKKLALLNLDTNKELIDSEDHLFSIVFISLIGSKAPEDISKRDIKEFKNACQDYIQSIKEVIIEFLKYFEISPCTDQWGYGLYAEYSDLKKNKEIIPILSILQQLDYLKFINKEDFNLLVRKYNGDSLTTEKEATTSQIDLSKIEYICLLRYRAELYLYSNTAEISTMHLVSKEEGYI